MEFDTAGIKWGWRDDLENREELHRTASAMPMLGDVEIPDVVDPREVMVATGWLPRNQGNEGSCAGNSLATNVEFCYCVATNGIWHRFSSDFLYYYAQKLDGITGDNGSTIDGGVRTVKGHGPVTEELYLSTGRYDPRPFTRDMLQNGSIHKLFHHVLITTYEEARQWLGSGLGAIHTGQSWKRSLNSDVVDSYSGASIGGHSVAIVGYSDRKDTNGDQYLIMANSWGTEFGNQGFAEWSPTCVNQILQSRNTEWVGLSDMYEMTPRPGWNYIGQGSLLF